MELNKNEKNSQENAEAEELLNEEPKNIEENLNQEEKQDKSELEQKEKKVQNDDSKLPDSNRPQDENTPANVGPTSQERVETNAPRSDIDRRQNVTNDNVEGQLLGTNDDDGDFVMIDDDGEFKYEIHRKSFYSQMETILYRQIDTCEYYKKYFEKQDNVTMANKFSAYAMNTTKNLDLLKLCWKNNEILPKYKFEHINFNCLPVNAYIRDKEVQITIKASNLPISEGSITYVIGEFAYPHSKDELLTETVTRWFRYSMIDPKNFLSCCTNAEPKQLDSVTSVESVPFNDPECKKISYNRPLIFTVEKGKSRTLKRKFKLVKLTFYEKKNFLSFDKKIGTVQLKIDGINDNISILTRQNIMDGRRQTDATVDIRVRVREALVDKSIREHELKFLLLT